MGRARGNGAQYSAHPRARRIHARGQLIGPVLARYSHSPPNCANLQVHWLGSEGLPGNVLGDDERWTLLRRCLRDDSLALRLRVAGALVLLYGQIPTRIVELTVDNVTTTETATYVVQRDQPVFSRHCLPH